MVSVDLTSSLKAWPDRLSIAILTEKESTDSQPDLCTARATGECLGDLGLSAALTAEKEKSTLPAAGGVGLGNGVARSRSYLGAATVGREK